MAKRDKTVETLGLVDYIRPVFITFSFQDCKDTIDSISRLSELEKGYADELNASKQPMILRKEQNSEIMFKTFVKKYTQLGRLLFDPFPGSYVT